VNPKIGIKNRARWEAGYPKPGASKAVKVSALSWSIARP
jgi:hypothetical protein